MRLCFSAFPVIAHTSELSSAQSDLCNGSRQMSTAFRCSDAGKFHRCNLFLVKCFQFSQPVLHYVCLSVGFCVMAEKLQEMQLL